MKVGDYVRTRWGCIAKFEGINEGFYEFDNIIMDESSAVREELLVDIVEKSSPNIIDLIEVGDYVNGEQVSRIIQCPEYHLGDGILIFNEHNETIYSNFRTSKYYDIKSIVTHEQFSQMEYRIGE